VIAEGIETAGERDFLAASGIDLMQGYLFAKPQFRGLPAIAEAAWAAAKTAH
jgi:EAL domain-containing protein (putative c-di-GMP-specific phosphodiesterase class I)